MSYAVFNQDGVHLCAIPLNVYQVPRRQSLAAIWLYWVQCVNLVRVTRQIKKQMSTRWTLSVLMMSVVAVFRQNRHGMPIEDSATTE